MEFITWAPQVSLAEKYERKVLNKNNSNYYYIVLYGFTIVSTHP